MHFEAPFNTDLGFIRQRAMHSITESSFPSIPSLVTLVYLFSGTYEFPLNSRMSDKHREHWRMGEALFLMVFLSPKEQMEKSYWINWLLDSMSFKELLKTKIGML